MVVQGVRDLDQLVTAAGLVVQAAMGLTLLIPVGLVARAAARAVTLGMVELVKMETLLHLVMAAAAARAAAAAAAAMVAQAV
jgi:hypothetical protein